MRNCDEYVHPKLEICSVDIYVIRRAILEAINQFLPLLSGTLIDVGCGYMPYREKIMSYGKVINYIGLDLEQTEFYRNTPDLLWDGTTIPLKDNSVDCAMATELFEHCFYPEEVMKEICRVIKPGGILVFTVPFLWPLHDVPQDHYRFTPFSLNRHLTNSGFHKIFQSSLGGWDKCLAQMIGLYVRRRQMSPLLRYFVSLVALPLVYGLSRGAPHQLKNEVFHNLQSEFKESSMIVGIYGIAYKAGKL